MITKQSAPAREWWVFVHSAQVGYIGTVMESTEALARLAALSRYAAHHDGDRGRSTDKTIFLDDDFDVRPVR